MEKFKTFRISLVFWMLLPICILAQNKKISDTPSAVVEVSENEIEDIYKANLKKKIPNSESKAWYLNTTEETYFAECYVNDVSNRVYFSKTGEWLKTQTDIARSEMNMAILEYIAANYKGYKISRLYKEINADKTLYTVVDFYEKANYKEGLITTAYFNKSNRPVKINRPNMPKQNGNNKIEAKDVPALVVTALNRKAPKPTELSWYKEDKLFYAKCFSKDVQNELWLDDTGGVVKMRVQVPEAKINPKITKYLNENHPKYQLVSAIKESLMGKRDCFYIQIIEKQYAKEKLYTTVVFNKSGVIIRTDAPEVPEEIDEAAIDKEKSKDEEFEKMLNEADNKSKKPMKSLKVNDIPPSIASYVNSNYPGWDFKKIEILEDKELGYCYEIVIGSFDESAELYFDINGQFLKSLKDDSSDDE